MKFSFSALKNAHFAATLFAKAGLNLEQMAAAADENALKAHIEAAVLEAGKVNAETETALSEAVAENARVTGEVNAAKTLAGTVSATLAGHGVKIEDCNDEKGAFSAEKFNAALNAHVSKSTTMTLAKSGHPPVQHIDASAAGGVTMNRADFDRLNATQQSEFAANVRKGVAKLID